MGRHRKFTADLEDRIHGMGSRGMGPREIAAVLTEEGTSISAPTVSRILNPPADRRPTVPTAGPPRAAPRREGTVPGAVPPPPPSFAEEPAEESIEIGDDPREISKGHWLYYETLAVRLRRRADRELGTNNLRGFDMFQKLALQAEKRAAELRPPAPPDPEQDPTYRKAAQALTSYLEALVSAAERGAPLPPRELPATEAA